MLRRAGTTGLEPATLSPDKRALWPSELRPRGGSGGRSRTCSSRATTARPASWTAPERTAKVGPAGVEPASPRVSGERSTAELRPHGRDDGARSRRSIHAPAGASMQGRAVRWRRARRLRCGVVRATRLPCGFGARASLSPKFGHADARTAISVRGAVFLSRRGLALVLGCRVRSGPCSGTNEGGPPGRPREETSRARGGLALGLLREVVAAQRRSSVVSERHAVVHHSSHIGAVQEELERNSARGSNPVTDGRGRFRCATRRAHRRGAGRGLLIGNGLAAVPHSGRWTTSAKRASGAPGDGQATSSRATNRP